MQMYFMQVASLGKSKPSIQCAQEALAAEAIQLLKQAVKDR